MYYLYLLSFKLLHAIGLKKSSVRLARSLEQYATGPKGKSKLSKAIWEFTLNTAAFPLCQGEFGCYFPVLSEHDPYHMKCRNAQAAADAELDDALHYMELMNSFCSETDPHCFEEADPNTGKCPGHDTYCYQCDYDPCKCAELAAAEEDYNNSLDEDDYDPRDYEDYIDDNDGVDPIACDIDDGSNYVPDPGPLDTQHYFPLKQRGYI